MDVDGEVIMQVNRDEEMAKEGVHEKKRKDCTHDIRTRFNTLTAVLSLLSLSFSLRNSILEVSRGALHIKDELFHIFHYILNGEMQLRILTEVSTGNQKPKAGELEQRSSREPTHLSNRHPYSSCLVTSPLGYSL